MDRQVFGESTKTMIYRAERQACLHDGDGLVRYQPTMRQVNATSQTVAAATTQSSPFHRLDRGQRTMSLTSKNASDITVPKAAVMVRSAPWFRSLTTLLGTTSRVHRLIANQALSEAKRERSFAAKDAIWSHALIHKDGKGRLALGDIYIKQWQLLGTNIPRN